MSSRNIPKETLLLPGVNSLDVDYGLLQYQKKIRTNTSTFLFHLAKIYSAFKKKSVLHVLVRFYHFISIEFKGCNKPCN